MFCTIHIVCIFGWQQKFFHKLTLCATGSHTVFNASGLNAHSLKNSFAGQKIGLNALRFLGLIPSAKIMF